MEWLNERAADWVAQMSWEQIPAEVVATARLQILDLVGVMLAARPLELVAAAERAALENDAGTGAAILGRAGETSLSAAAMVNGVLSAILEFDDTHIETFIHPTAAPLSAALPMCQGRGLSGKQLIEAVTIGSELTCRIGRITPIRLHSLGLHPTAVLGIFGAVYAQARLHGMSAAQIVSAIGHAGSMSGGLMASWEDGTSTKTMHVGLAASAAVRAVGLARHGISGPRSVFEGRYGWFRTHVQSPPSDFRFAAMLDRLGSEWEILNVASKAYPSAFTIHPYVDAVFALKHTHAIDPADIVEIRCDIAKSSAATLCEPLAEKLRPLTTWHGRVSLQHSVAEALILDRMDKNAYAPEYLNNPAINALAEKVKYVVDPKERDGSGARVAMTLRDGREVEHTVAHMRGTRRNPISQEDYIAKFKANTSDVIDARVMDRTIEGLLELDRIDNVKPLFDGLIAAG